MGYYWTRGSVRYSAVRVAQSFRQSISLCRRNNHIIAPKTPSMFVLTMSDSTHLLSLASLASLSSLAFLAASASARWR